MNTTQSTLLERIRDLADDDAWREFRRLYAPLLYHYARALGLSHDDAEDVRAKCYEAIVINIGEFEYERQRGGFKAWLRTMAHRRVIDLQRKRREVALASGELADQVSPESSPDVLFDRVWEAEHLRYCVEEARANCTEATYLMFKAVVLDERPVDDVCHELNVSRNQIYKAKSRLLDLVRRRMRELGASPESSETDANAKP